MTSTITAPRPAAAPAPASNSAPQLPPADPTPRRIRALTFDDWTSLWGAGAASLALVSVVYDHILHTSGTLGFLLSWYAAFLLVYGALVAMTNPRPIVVDRLATTAAWAAAAVVLTALGSTVYFTFAKGWVAYLHPGFLDHTMAGVSPTAPLSQGGIAHAIVGTFIEVGVAVAVSVPLGVGTAVYLSEVGGRLSRLVRTVVEAMTALPEILAGLFVYVTLIVGLGLPKSGLAASIAMSVTMVPIIARAAEVTLRIVPRHLREASLALGSSRWRTVRKVVLPTALPGLTTATILGVSRGVGETAIVLITSGTSSFMILNPVTHEMNSLPLYIYTAIKTGQPAAIERGFGAASVLLTIVLLLFAAARFATRVRSSLR